MTFKYFVTLETGFCGSTAHEFIQFETEPSEDELNKICWELAVQNADSYGIYPAEDRLEDYDEEDDEHDVQYSSSIEGFAVPYCAEKHDMYVVGHNSEPIFHNY